MSTFILSDNDFTGGNYNFLGQGIARAANLTAVSLDNVNMYDEDIANLSQPWQNQTIALRNFNAADNLL